MFEFLDVSETNSQKEMLPCLFLILRRMRNAATNNRVATAIGTTIAITSVLLLFFSNSQVEASLSHRSALLPVLALEQHLLKLIQFRKRKFDNVLV